MTAIAYRAGILAADTAAFDEDNLILGRCKKITRLPDGWTVAMSGDAADCLRMEKVFRSDKNPPLSTFKELTNSCEGILVSPKLKVFTFRHDTGMEPAVGHYQAVGAASQFLMGAMAVRAGAAEAVKAACKGHAFARGPVQVVKCGK